ncbi:MAG TPA: alpha/beta hydrolase [Candidatus Dormibacteraeota bacterium]|nr:alpha/beta hydrolase [Candidatus Dormibacteraeota bacterium]
MDTPMLELTTALEDWLAEAHLAASSQFAHTPVGRVHVLVAGQGRCPLVLVPGLGASSADFAALLACLATDHLVVGIDLPGTGLSDPVGFKGHPREAWDQVITAVADRLGLTEFTLIGHSLGGLAAGAYAISHPERVSKLVLLSPFGIGRRIPFLWNFSMVPGLMQLRGLYQRAVTPPPRPFPGWTSPGVQRCEMGSAGERYRRRVSLRFGSGSDLELIGRLLQPLALRSESQLLPALGLLSGRVQVIWGEEDRRLPLHRAQAELDSFPGLRLDVVPGAGHLLPVMHPTRTATLIRDFLGTSAA